MGKSKLDNYIYYDICEEAFALKQTTAYSTFRNYCVGLKNAINQKELSQAEKRHIATICDVISNIYALNSDRSAKYVYTFFNDNLFIRFEKAVAAMDYHHKVARGQ